jgi:hypothetical protein
MIIYNVTIKVANEIVADWQKWMKEIHLKDMMATGKFLGYRMCKLEQITDDDDSSTFVVQYECNSMAEYDAYIKDDSEAMRQDGVIRFGNQFIAFRTIMDVIATSN